MNSEEPTLAIGNITEYNTYRSTMQVLLGHGNGTEVKKASEVGDGIEHNTEITLLYCSFTSNQAKQIDISLCDDLKPVLYLFS